MEFVSFCQFNFILYLSEFRTLHLLWHVSNKRLAIDLQRGETLSKE